MDLKRQIETGIKLRGIDKVSRIPIKIFLPKNYLKNLNGFEQK